jgi:hypothetical protein
MVSWFVPQNQVGFGLFHVEASLTSISQSGLNTGGGATAGGACGIIAEAASDPATLPLPFSMY